MADVFGFGATLGDKGFIEPSDGGVIIGEENTVTLVQDWQIQYQMNVNPIYECGTSKVYWSAKHASGTFTVNRVITDNVDLRKRFGWICQPATFVVKAYSNYCDVEKVTEQEVEPGGKGQKHPVNLLISGSILGGVTYSGNSQQAYVSENLTAQFSGLSVETGTAESFNVGTTT